MERMRLVLVAALLAAGCSSSVGVKSTSTGAGGATTGSEPAATATAKPTAPAGRVHKLASGLIYEDVVIGNGTMADPGLQVAVNYTGRFTDGTEFDSSNRSGRPYMFTLGTGAVIAGWDQGIKGMRVGGKRKLTIPPDLAYGASGMGGVIPPNATLLFDVELVGVH